MSKITVAFCAILISGYSAIAQEDERLDLAMQLEYDQPDSSVQIINELLADDVLDEKAKSIALEVKGIALWVQEKYGEAITCHTAALSIRKDINYLSGVAHSYNNLGLNYQSLGDPKMAMQNFLDAQTMAEEQKDTALTAKVLGNIGTLYEEQGAAEKALDFYGRSLSYLEGGSNQRVLGNTLNNIAIVYYQLDERKKARNFIQRSLSIRELIDDKFGIAQSLNFLGLLESGAGNLKAADTLFRSSLSVYRELENHWGQSMVYGNLGADANAIGDYNKGVEYCSLSLSIAQKHSLEWGESACECLAESYSGLEKIEKSSYYWKRLVVIKDSLRKDNALSEISLIQKRFEFEKERLEAEHRFQQERLVSEAEIERQKTLRQAALGLGMMGIFLFFVVFRSYQSKQRDNELLEFKNTEISDKNKVIEDKNKHITDSIRYAQNLQSAILPKESTFGKYFSDFHILYKPKDIVSGDFYWMEEVNGTIFLAAADCTGHGVPGAMVSMVGFQGLNKAVLEEKLTSPAAILQRLSDHVEEAFEKSGGSVKDGMDICLVAIDLKKRIVTYAGAHNALWILTSKEELPNANLREEEDGKRMFELKADRRSIGGFMDAGSFTEKVVELNEGGRLFLFSDGFADQFGGPQGKKMGSKRMRETCRQMAVSGNMLALGAIFEDWKAQEEQIDDVTVISVVV